MRFRLFSIVSPFGAEIYGNLFGGYFSVFTESWAFSQTIYRFLDTISAGLATDQHVYVVEILSECDMRYTMLKFLDDLSCEGVSDLLRVGILPCLCRFFFRQVDMA